MTIKNKKKTIKNFMTIKDNQESLKEKEKLASSSLIISWMLLYYLFLLNEIPALQKSSSSEKYMIIDGPKNYALGYCGFLTWVNKNIMNTPA